MASGAMSFRHVLIGAAVSAALLLAQAPLTISEHRSSSPKSDA
jgi:hypothetical protein